LRAETYAHLLAAFVKLPEEAFRIHSRKVILPQDTLWRRVGMDFKRQPLIDNSKFLLQPFDNTFADIAEGSDII